MSLIFNILSNCLGGKQLKDAHAGGGGDGSDLLKDIPKWSLRITQSMRAPHSVHARQPLTVRQSGVVNLALEDEVSLGCAAFLLFSFVRFLSTLNK